VIGRSTPSHDLTISTGNYSRDWVQRYAWAPCLHLLMACAGVVRCSVLLLKRNRESLSDARPPMCQLGAQGVLEVLWARGTRSGLLLMSFVSTVVGLLRGHGCLAGIACHTAPICDRGMKGGTPTSQLIFQERAII